MNKNKIIVISVAVFALSITVYFVSSSASFPVPNSIKVTGEPVDVTVEAVYKTQGNALNYNYSGIIMSTKRFGNFTAFQLADSFSVLTSADSSGTSFQTNMINDPYEKIRVGKVIRIAVLETSPICSVNLIFKNGTKIINADNVDLNDATKYNKTITGDKRCLAGNIVRLGLNWNVS